MADHADNRLVTEDQRSLAFVSQFLLVSGLVRNRHFSAEDLCDVHGLVSARQARAASGQKSCDLCPCPLRLRSSLLVLGCTGLMRSTRFRQFPILLRRSPDSVHRQSAELPCCSSVTSYQQCYRSEDRRVPTVAVVGQVDDFRCCSTTGAWS